jgi:hypothetical protein
MAAGCTDNLVYFLLQSAFSCFRWTVVALDLRAWVAAPRLKRLSTFAEAREA